MYTVSLGSYTDYWDTWHTDPRCPRLSEPHPLATRSPDLLALTRKHDATGRSPCRLCAKDVLLDAVADRAQRPGYTMMSCRERHLGATCPGCDTLSDWAELTEHVRIFTVCRRRFCVLISGYLDDDCLRSVAALGHSITAISARGDNLPDVDEDMFAIVAGMVEDEQTSLGDAIAAAGALYAAAAAT